MDKVHVMRLDLDETFNVTLIDANHCPGAVMYLFEGYFGVVLATGDFRYDPSLFVDTPLKDKEVDICYLDNTYFNPAFYNTPTRDEALKKIISIIQDKREENILFRIHLRNLGKEKLLVDLSEYFQIPIVVPKKRFERYTKVLEIDEKYFRFEFDSNSLIFIEDFNDCENFCGYLKDKKIIHIEPSALIIPDKRRSRSDPSYFQVPYTDHSSYLEIIDFIQLLKPKRLIPIVRRMLPNNLDTTDLKELDKYLSQKPVASCSEKYKLLLQSSTSSRRSSRLNSYRLSDKKTSSVDQSSKNLPNRNLTPINTRYITVRNRTSKKLKKRIEYDTPEKAGLQTNDIEENDRNKTPTKISFSSTRRLISLSSVKKSGSQLKLVASNLGTIVEENKSDLSFETSFLQENEFLDVSNKKCLIEEAKDQEEIGNSQGIKTTKWKRLSEQVELLEQSIETESDSSSLFSPCSVSLNNSPSCVTQKECLKEIRLTSSRLNPVVMLEMLKYEDIGKQLQLRNNIITETENEACVEIEDKDEQCLNENNNEDELNSSKESIVIDHTIQDQIESNLENENEAQMAENISSGQFVHEENFNGNMDTGADKLMEVLQSELDNQVGKRKKSQLENETEEFFNFMDMRLRSMGYACDNEDNLKEMMNTHILEAFHF